jgi:hypothetical protein
MGNDSVSKGSAQLCRSLNLGDFSGFRSTFCCSSLRGKQIVSTTAMMLSSTNAFFFSYMVWGKVRSSKLVQDFERKGA